MNAGSRWRAISSVALQHGSPPSTGSAELSTGLPALGRSQSADPNCEAFKGTDVGHGRWRGFPYPGHGSPQPVDIRCPASHSEAMTRLRGHYGIDAPYAPLLIGLGALLFALLAVWSTGFMRIWWTLWALLLVLMTLTYLHATLRGKFRLWERIADELDLSGDEQVLDLGCGRGMAMLTLARKLPDGTAVGVDLWRSRDQTGNDVAAAEANAEAVGVADRVEFRTADMSTLPFPDGSFDIVIANVSIQNIKDRDRRAVVIDEVLRVLVPGGRVRIADIQYTRQYPRDLTAAGARDVTVRSAGPGGWFGNPWFATRVVSARK